MNRYTLLFCLLCCLVAVVGCGKNARLTGKVTFTDGALATSGTVCFRTDKFMARGEIKSDGSYTMSSEGTNDGLPPGEYQVYVQGIFEMPAGQTPQNPNQMVLPVLMYDPKYGDPETSGLTCKVPAPGNKFDIVLERLQK
jgi:hypothetical protein